MKWLIFILLLFGSICSARAQDSASLRHWALGWYLYRHMGSNAEEVEKPYYEHIGVHYTIPSFHNLTFGINVKAHLTKADYTEIILSLPFRLKK